MKKKKIVISKFFNVIPAKAGFQTLLAISLLSGCVSTGTIDKDYHNLGHLENGADARQAKIIAQKTLLNTEEKDFYRISFPDIKTGLSAQKYPGYWFVVFGHNWLEPLSQDALRASYSDLRETEYLVVIDKETGKTRFFGEWYPKRENDFDWVFDPKAYKRRDSIALPPGKQSKEMFKGDL